MSETSEATRFDALLQRLAEFGGDGRSVTRLVYDPAWCAAQRWLADEARSRGLVASADSAGNLFFHDADVRPGDLARPVLLVGSHLDSVRGGGRYDGAYGVLAGLVLAAEHRGRPGLPVVGFVTSEEEQSRFDAPMMGARSLLGLTAAADLDRVSDAEGVSWRAARDAAEQSGCAAPIAAGEAPFRPWFRAAVTLEPHIEQGPTLESERRALGIVTHIAGYQRWRLHVQGSARHAGTTPMTMRRDALAGAAEMIVAAEALAGERGDPARVTAGNVRVEPGLFNVSPGGAELWLEVRHAEAEALAALAATLTERCRAIAARRKLTLTAELVTGQEPTPLSERLAAEAERVARESGFDARRIVSGAGHDTMEFARAGAESLMVFVPSRDGISHSADEYTDPNALWTGVRFTSALITRISGGAGA